MKLQLKTWTRADINTKFFCRLVATNDEGFRQFLHVVYSSFSMGQLATKLDPDYRPQIILEKDKQRSITKTILTWRTDEISDDIYVSD